MFRRIPLTYTLGGFLLVDLILFGISLYALLFWTNLLWHGVTTKGIITSVETEICGTSRNGIAYSGPFYSVQFTDQTGQTHTSTFNGCDYIGFNASPGDSVTIVYLPDNPTKIAPLEGLNSNIQLFLSVTVLLGLIALVLLPFLVRKLILKRSLQDQQGQIELSADPVQQKPTDFSAFLAEQGQQEQIESSADPALPKQPLAFPPLPESSLTSTSAIPWLKPSYNGSETSITGTVTLSIVHQSQDGVLRAKWIRDDFGVEYSCEGTITREGTITLMSTDSHRDSALRIHGSMLANGHLEGILYAISKDGSSQRHSWSLA